MDNALLLQNMTPVQKADLAVTDLTTGGQLLPQPASAFIQDLIVRSVLMPMATVRAMTAQNEHMPRINFGQRVLRPSQDSTALSAADRSKPGFTNTELTTKGFKGEVRIPDEVLEDNIEKDQLKATIMTMMGRAVARDLEQISILGDTASNDNYLAQFNGALKMSTSHVVDAVGASLNRSILTSMIKTLPQQYKDDRKSMTFITSTNGLLDLANSLGNRQTAGGDNLVFDNDQVKFQGIPVVDISMFPDNLGTGMNTTDVLLMNPKNLVIGIWREIRIETARDITTSETIIVVSLRIGVQYALEDAIVKAINVKSAA